MTDAARENTRAAIALLTAMLEDDSKTSEFVTVLSMQLVDELGGDDERAGLLALVIGMANLSTDLLVKLARAEATSEQEALREIAAKYL